jgi:hypothetical protein
MNPQPMIVLTAKRDGGTQDVLGFYPGNQGGLARALVDAERFLGSTLNDTKRSIVRIEHYNPCFIYGPR